MRERERKKKCVRERETSVCVRVRETERCVCVLYMCERKRNKYV